MTQAEADVEQLHQALDRLGNGAYGVCARCRAPIPDERLAAQPTTLTCVGCAQAGPATNASRLRRA